MNNKPPIEFDDLAESKEFRQFFDIVRELTDIQVVLADPDATREKWLFPRDKGTPLCRLIHSCASGNATCRETDRRHYRQAIQKRKAIHYLCHAGLIDMVVPIYVRGMHVATLNGGQVLPEPPTEKGYRACRKRLKGIRLVPGDLRRAYFQSQYCPPTKVIKAMELLAFFAEYFSEVGWRLRAIRRNELQLATRAKQFIRDHFQEPIGLADIARAAFLSPTYFSTAFHHETGETVVKHLQATRVQAAQSLLKSSSQNITDIAFKTGFNSLTHFNRVFRKAAGCPPREWRRRNAAK